MNNINKFDGLYNKLYDNFDVINKLEKKRLKLFWQYKIQLILYFVIIPIIIFLPLLHIVIQEKILLYLSLPSILFLITLIFFIYKYFRKFYEKKFTKDIKYHVINFLICKINNIKWFQRSNEASSNSISVIPNNELYQSDLFSRFNERYCDDEYSGEYKNVLFNVSETILKNIGRTKKDAFTSFFYSCIFKGIIITFDFNKIIKNKTIILPPREIIYKRIDTLIVIIILSFYSLGILFYLLNTKKNFIDSLPLYFLLTVGFIPPIMALFDIIKEEKRNRRKNKVTLEDSKFIKKFDVYSSDQIEARYLITPTFMERFYDLKMAFNAKNIKCSFYNNNLMIAISTNKNIFEIGSLFRPINNKKIIKQFFKEIESIYNMIDYLKLNQEIKL